MGLAAPWVELKVYNMSIRPFIFASLVVVGLIPFAHWCMITPTIFRDELVMVSEVKFDIFKLKLSK